ncbi:MAG: tetratricopeptide repeat protein [bacterium]|nr:tetratricopeptide repeat protein [bacterium]
MRWSAVFFSIMLLTVSVSAQTDDQTGIDFADSLFQHGYYEMAAEAYRDYLEKNPDGDRVAAALERLGESEFSLKNYEAALTRFEKLLELKVEGLSLERALLRKGEILFRLDRSTEAAPVLAQVAGKDKNPEVRAGALYYLGMAHYRVGKGAEGEAAAKAYQASITALSTLGAELPDSPLAPYARYQLARVYLAKNDLEKAAIEFTAVADSTMPDERLKVESRFRAAEMYDRIGWFDAAVTAYQKLQTDFPGSEYAERAQLGYAWALFNASKYEDAGKAAAAFIQANPESPSTLGMRYLQANCSQQRKDYAKALDQYKAIRNDHPDSEFSPRALYKIAWTLHLAGKNEEARKRVKLFLDTYKDSPLVGEAAFLRGSILVAEENFADAHDEFRYVWEKYPDSEFGAEALFKVGECLAQLGRMEEAAQVFESFIKKYPDNPMTKDALARSAEVSFFSASFEEAIQGFKRTLESAPDPGTEMEILYRMAITYHNMKDYKASAETFGKILQKFPECPHAAEANFRIGDYYLYEVKDPVKSIAPHQAAYDAAPKGPHAGRALRGLALARYQTKDYDRAADLFLKLMTDHPAVKLNEQTFAWVGEHFYDAKKWDEASTTFKSLLATITDYANPERVQFRIAQCAESKGDAKGAIALYEEVVKEAPRSASALNARFHMATLHEGLKDGDKAFALYQEVANTNTGDAAARARMRLGEILEEREDYAGAAKNYMLIALLLFHEDLSPKALWRAGQCFENSEKPDQAKRAYDELVADYADTEWAAKATARLAEWPGEGGS